eukprot:scaffold175444_cov50-Tisochrysis_lutea.AAC.2
MPELPKVVVVEMELSRLDSEAALTKVRCISAPYDSPNTDDEVLPMSSSISSESEWGRSPFEHERVTGDGESFGIVWRRSVGQHVEDAAEHTGVCHRLCVHRLCLLLLVRVRVEVRRQPLGAVAVLVPVGDGLDEVDAEGVAWLCASRRRDGQQLRALEGDDAAHLAVFFVQVGVSRVRLAIRVGHEQVERVKASIHEEDDNCLVSLALSDEPVRSDNARLALLVEVGRVEFERNGKQLQRASERRVLAPAGCAIAISLGDYMVRVRRETARGEQQAELIDYLRSATGGGAGYALHVAAACPRRRREA